MISDNNYTYSSSKGTSNNDNYNVCAGCMVHINSVGQSSVIYLSGGLFLGPCQVGGSATSGWGGERVQQSHSLLNKLLREQRLLYIRRTGRETGCVRGGLIAHNGEGFVGETGGI